MKKPLQPFLRRAIYWSGALAILILVSIVGYHYSKSVIKTVNYFVTKKLNLPFAGSKPTKLANKITPVRLQEIGLTQKNSLTNLDLFLNNKTTYYAERRTPEQLVVTLSNAELAGNLPVSLDNSFITALNTAQIKNNIVITLQLLPGTKLSELQLLEEPSCHLHLAFANQQLTDSKISKTPVPISPEEEAQQNYLEIKQLIRQNKMAEAISKLQLLLGDSPNHLPARETLGVLLIKDGKLTRALEIITLGLQRQPDYHPFIKLKAHILVQQNQIKSAIELLAAHLATTSDLEYLALLGALYQEDGQFMQAAAVYDQLTKLEPEKTLWWLGLGIALEMAGKKNAAAEAYQKANKLSDIPPELNSFLHQKTKK